jgi:hypothetical protein
MAPQWRSGAAMGAPTSSGPAANSLISYWRNWLRTGYRADHTRSVLAAFYLIGKKVAHQEQWKLTTREENYDARNATPMDIQEKNGTRQSYLSSPADRDRGLLGNE